MNYFGHYCTSMEYHSIWSSSIFDYSCEGKPNCVNYYSPNVSPEGCFLKFLKLSAAVCCSIEVKFIIKVSVSLLKCELRKKAAYTPFSFVIPLSVLSYFYRSASSKERVCLLSVDWSRSTLHSWSLESLPYFLKYKTRLLSLQLPKVLDKIQAATTIML